MPDYTITNHYNARTGSDGWIITLADRPQLSFHLRHIVTGYCETHFVMWTYLDTAQAPVHFWPKLEVKTLTDAAEFALNWALLVWQDDQLPTIELAGFWLGDLCQHIGHWNGEFSGDPVYVVGLAPAARKGSQDRIAIRNAVTGQRGSVQPADLALVERQTLEVEISTWQAEHTLEPDRLVVRFPQVTDRYYVIYPPTIPHESAMLMTSYANKDHKPIRTWRCLRNPAEAIRTAQIDVLASAIRLTTDENDADHLHRRGHAGDQVTHTSKYGESPYERGFYCTMYSVHFSLTDWTGKADTGCWATDCWSSSRSGIAREIIERGNRWANWLPPKD